MFNAFHRVEKEFSQRLINLNGQKKKLEETVEKKEEELSARLADLDKQLLVMREKFKVSHHYLLLSASINIAFDTRLAENTLLVHIL